MGKLCLELSRHESSHPSLGIYSECTFALSTKAAPKPTLRNEASAYFFVIGVIMHQPQWGFESHPLRHSTALLSCTIMALCLSVLFVPQIVPKPPLPFAIHGNRSPTVLLQFDLPAMPEPHSRPVRTMLSVTLHWKL